MEFEPIDLATWERREHFEYYTRILKTNYHMNVNVEITSFYEWTKKEGYRFFPSFLYVVMRAVNQNREFRMAYKENVLGFYQVCHPSYTIFHPDDHTFSDIWSEYSPDFRQFYKNCVDDMEQYRDVKGIKAKPGRPDNFCPVSCAPWISFTGFGHDTTTPSNMYFPVINFGKYFKEGEKLCIPVSVHVNHAAADGYHTSMLLLDIQNIAENMEKIV